MQHINRPSKETIRKWMLERRSGRAPLPDSEQIRRQLNWRKSNSVVMSNAGFASTETYCTNC
jgi:hypothetical protein